MDDEKGKFQFAGIKFLYDMELVDDPQLVNNMKLNVFSISASVRDVEFLSSYQHRSMLIWLDLNWFGRKFLSERIVAGVTERVQALLPQFRFRVTTDRKIFDLALARVKTALKGVPNEKVPSVVDGDDVSKSDSSVGPDDSKKSGVPEDSGSESDGK